MSRTDWDRYALEKETANMRFDKSHLFVIDTVRSRYGKGPSDFVLDAGCGDGSYAGALSKLGTAVAADASFVQTKRLKNRGFLSIQCDLSKPPFKENSFSFIFCNQVLEHVPDPMGIIRALYFILEKGGTMVISTPNRFAPTRFLDLSFLRRLDKTHLREYNLVTAFRVLKAVRKEFSAVAELGGYSSIGRGGRKFFWWKALPEDLKRKAAYFIYSHPVLARGFVFVVKKREL
jgi:2-polyprenyl-3-methyl-5-hydroxy-6-metoxy-1,4-benzoquinol methylase